MNITDADGKWLLTPGYITNRKTNEVRSVPNLTSSVAASIASMPYRRFVRKCQEAFDTGNWPN